MNKLEKINEIRDLLDQNMVNDAIDKLDDYVESKITERDIFLNKMVVVSYIKTDPDFHLQNEMIDLVGSAKASMASVFNPDHAVCLVVASPDVKTRVEVINPKTANEDQVEELIKVIRDYQG
jgi:hypothetical protein